MQLKKQPVRIREALTVATCSLLGATPSQVSALTDTPWAIDTSVLYYSEKDRVTVIKPVAQARIELADEEFLTVKAVYDTMTGSSANGAVPTASAQTFTSPSGNETYTTPANTTPLDPTFKDSRTAGTVEWEKPLTDRLKGLFSGNLSLERDYFSLGVGATLQQDFNDRNTTLTAGVAYNRDIVRPEGGTPEPLSLMPVYVPDDGDEEDEDHAGRETKSVVELLLGISQVLSRNTLVQFNYGYGTADGYLTDPYKILSVVETDGNLITPADPDFLPYAHESRPDSRTSQTLYWKLVHQFNTDVINLSYRYYFDDWDVRSHTVDLRYRYEFDNGHYLQPHVRYYQQSAAEFYRRYLIDGVDDGITYASADYRLGELTTRTIGLKYGIPLGHQGEFNIRAEYMEQSGDNHPASAIGVLRDQDLFPTVTAYIVQLGLSFQFDAARWYFWRK